MVCRSPVAANTTQPMSRHTPPGTLESVAASATSQEPAAFAVATIFVARISTPAIALIIRYFSAQPADGAKSPSDLVHWTVSPATNDRGSQCGIGSNQPPERKNAPEPAESWRGGECLNFGSGLAS